MGSAWDGLCSNQGRLQVCWAYAIGNAVAHGARPEGFRVLLYLGSPSKFSLIQKFFAPRLPFVVSSCTIQPLDLLDSCVDKSFPPLSTFWHPNNTPKTALVLSSIVIPPLNCGSVASRFTGGRAILNNENDPHFFQTESLSANHEFSLVEYVHHFQYCINIPVL